jgi:hypothetical protein
LFLQMAFVAAALCLHACAAALDSGSALPAPHTLGDAVEALGGRDQLLDALRRGAEWLTTVSQITTDDLPSGVSDKHYETYRGRWRGAFRGEYQAGSYQWGFFGPAWHCGQAVKALVLASRALVGDDERRRRLEWTRAAAMGAEFILDKQVLSTPDAGLLLALEQPGDGMDTFPSSSAMLESLDGLLELSALTKNATYADRALNTARWVRDNAYIDEPAALAASNT